MIDRREFLKSAVAQAAAVELAGESGHFALMQSIS